MQLPSSPLVGAALAALLLSGHAALAQDPTATARPAPKPAGAAPGKWAQIERGRYLIQTSGCNDCHTPGYAMNNGKVDEKQWLLGDGLGWSGPWGTTYAPNLRLYMQGHSEASWLKTAKSFEARPPMPWFNLHAMKDSDLRAIYHYVRSLQPLGEPAPAYLPPGQKPQGPAVSFPG